MFNMKMASPKVGILIFFHFVGVLSHNPLHINEDRMLIERNKKVDNSGGNWIAENFKVEIDDAALFQRELSKQTETYVEMPKIEMRFALSSIFDEFPSTLKAELLRLTVEHLSEFYLSLMEKNGTLSSFNRFFLAVSIHDSDSGMGGRRRRALRYNKSERNLQFSISSMTATFNGYAVFRGVPSDTERNVVNNLSTLAFIGESHDLFLNKIQASSNGVLSTVAQVSITSRGNYFESQPKDAFATNSDKNGQIDKGRNVQLNMALLFVLSCFTAGVFAGCFFFYKNNMKPYQRYDDETEETSKESFNNSFNASSGTYARRKGRCRSCISAQSSASSKRVSSKHVRPTESISIKPVKNIDDVYDGDDDESERRRKHRKHRPSSRRKKKLSSPYSIQSRTKSHEAVDVMSAIGEESDGELYIDLVDDIIQGDARQAGSMFPSLQDRLSNKRRGHEASTANGHFNYSYTPKKCEVHNNDHITYSTGCSRDGSSTPQLLLPPPSENNNSEVIYYDEMKMITTPKKNTEMRQALGINNGVEMSTELVTYGNGNSPMSVIQEIHEPLRPRLTESSEKKLFGEYEEHHDKTSTDIIPVYKDGGSRLYNNYDSHGLAERNDNSDFDGRR